MRSKAEKGLVRSLRAALADAPQGASVLEDEHMPDIKVCLEFWIPELLGWGEESLDAFRFCVARKTAECEIEVVGLALLISDQRWTPLRAVVRVSRSTDAVTAVDLGLGAPGNGRSGLLRLPYRSKDAVALLQQDPDALRATRWVFTARRGRVGA